MPESGGGQQTACYSIHRHLSTNADVLYNGCMRHADKILALLAQQSVLRPRDVSQHGIPSYYLSYLAKKGMLLRVGRGLYSLVDSDMLTENHTLVEACKAVPGGVVCLYSALRFHNIGTQGPADVWLAVNRKAWLPKLDYPPVRFVRFSEAALTAGVETHQIEGVPVRVYSPAKTVADCFKYRRKFGLDVAVEALRECLRDRRAAIDEIWHFAQVCRVAKVMRPYLEALT